MIADRLRGGWLMGLALFALAICLLHCQQLLLLLLDTGKTPSLREAAGLSLSLEGSWCLLLCWCLWRPVQRRQVLAFTAAPMFFSNLVHSLLLSRSGPFPFTNLLIGTVLASCYLSAAFIKPPLKLADDHQPS